MLHSSDCFSIQCALKLLRNFADNMEHKDLSLKLASTYVMGGDTGLRLRLDRKVSLLVGDSELIIDGEQRALAQIYIYYG